MALRMLENFSIYNRTYASLTRRWTSYSRANALGITNGGGRHSDDRLQLGGANTGGFDTITKVFDAQATWIVGFLFSFNFNPGKVISILSFYDGGTLHVDLRLNTSGQLYFTRNGTALNGTYQLTPNTPYFLEIKTTIADSGGVAALRVNGVTQIDGTGQDTRNGGNASADRIVLAVNQTYVGTYAQYYSDLYVCDGSATAPSDYLGDVRVDLCDPNGNGNSSQWTGSDGNSTDNYLLVDDSGAPDDDTTYVESSTATNVDLYTVEDVPTGATIYGVEVLTLSRKTDAGARSIRAVTRQDGTDYTGATVGLGDSYAYASERYPTAPDGTAWSATKFNALEIGAELVA